MLHLRVFHSLRRCTARSPRPTIPHIPTTASHTTPTSPQATPSSTPAPPSPTQRATPRHPSPQAGPERSSPSPSRPLRASLPPPRIRPLYHRIQIPSTPATSPSPVSSAHPPPGPSRSLKSPPSSLHSRRRMASSAQTLLPPSPSKEQGPAQVPASGWRLLPARARTPIRPFCPVIILSACPLTASPLHAVICLDHMFLSFHGTNELRLGNVAYQDTLDEIKEHIMPMWPHGVSSQMVSPLSWRVTFSRNPWSATGSDAIM